VQYVVEPVVVNAQGTSERVDVAIHWAGRFISQHEIRRPVGRYDLLHDFDRLRQRIAALRQEGKSCLDMAELLNAASSALTMLAVWLA
jgi:hypothetical protein